MSAVTRGHILMYGNRKSRGKIRDAHIFVRRVFAAIEEEGETRRRSAERTSIPLSTLYRWKDQSVERGGDLPPAIVTEIHATAKALGLDLAWLLGHRESRTRREKELEEKADNLEETE